MTDAIAHGPQVFERLSAQTTPEADQLPAKPQGAKTPTLSDGRTYRVLAKPKAKHLLRAQREAGPKNSESVIYYLTAALVEIDGQPITYEDLLELDLVDFNLLLEDVQAGGESQSQVGKASLP